MENAESPKVESPLSEAAPQSLDELFSSSPLEREPHEWTLIVETLRANRERWLADEASGKKRASAPKSAPLKAPPKELSIDDLDLTA